VQTEIALMSHFAIFDGLFKSSLSTKLLKCAFQVAPSELISIYLHA
jgi:hypothetical protein